MFSSKGESNVTSKDTRHLKETPSTSSNEMNKKRFNYIVQEPISKIKSLSVSVIVGSVEITSIIDTGATNNFLTERAFHSLKNKERKMAESVEKAVILADGRQNEILGEATLNFKVAGFNHCTFTEKFKIIKEIEVDCVLGMEFLLRQGLIINFNDMTLECNNESVLFGEQEIHDWRESPDIKFIESNRLFHLSEDRKAGERKINKIIEKFMNENPPLGQIPGVEFSIDLVNNDPIRGKPYPIPFKSYEKIKAEISKLLKLGVIKKSTSSYGAPAFGVSKKMAIYG